MSDFTYPPTYGVQVDKKPRVLVAAFGDGYEQRTADGINTIKQVWKLGFRGSIATITAIDTFLKTRAGITAFTWTPPGGSDIKVVCRDWSLTVADLNVRDISCTFEQVFE